MACSRRGRTSACIDGGAPYRCACQSSPSLPATAPAAVPVEAGGRYGVSLHLRAPHGPPANATVSLMSGGPVLPPVVLASISCAGLGPEWRRCAGELVSSTADYQARLAVSCAIGRGRGWPAQGWAGGLGGVG